MRKILIGFYLFCAMTVDAQSFEWRNLPLGGGGFLTGIVIHPKERDVIYARTDVGGIYRYEPGKRDGGHPNWKQLMQWIPVETAHLWGCDGIALNPQNGREVYALLGSYEYDARPYGLYKSEDRGETWCQVYETRCRGNGNGRWVGEPIAVQPSGRGRVVVVGTRYDGVVRSDDGGQTWIRSAGIAPDPEGWGVRCVVFDPSDPDVVYAVDRTTLWRSVDSGNSFEALWSKEGVELKQAAVTSDGRCFVTTGAGLYCSAAGRQPEPVAGFDMVYDLNAIAIDPQDPLCIAVAGTLGDDGVRNYIFWTSDGGRQWKELTEDAEVKNYVPWYGRRHFAAALASMAIDPFHRGNIWFTDWYLPWRCEDAERENPVWQSVPWGVEELVVFDIVSPPGAPLIYQGCADNGGFTHYELDEYPTVGYDNQESTGIDFCQNRPECLVRVSSLGWGQSNFRLSVSDDAGHTWRDVGGEIGTTGKVAYAADDSDNFIFAPTGPGCKVLYTKDRGKTPMRECRGIPAPGLNMNFWDNWNRHIASDRLVDGRFYVAMPGGFYVSEDGGETFERRWTGVPVAAGCPAFYLTASPYRAGTVWMSTGSEGLFRTEDAGETFEKVGRFAATKCVAVGPAIRDTIPAVYVYGLLDGVWGVYLSQDDGVSWVRINDDRMQLSNAPRQMAADPDRPGRVYIGTGGNGILYGEFRLPHHKERL